MTIEETYNNWRSSLKTPDESIFYYHRNVDVILLGLAIFVISSRPLLKKLGKAKMLGILHLQVPDLITAWIDEDEATFEQLFPMVMTISEGLIPCCIAAEKEYPSSKKAIRTFAHLLANATGAGGDMNPELADELLDDLSTDGREIYSDKIEKLGSNLLFLSQRYSIDIPYHLWKEHIGW